MSDREMILAIRNGDESGMVKAMQKYTRLLWSIAAAILTNTAGEQENSKLHMAGVCIITFRVRIPQVQGNVLLKIRKVYVKIEKIPFRQYPEGKTEDYCNAEYSRRKQLR